MLVKWNDGYTSWIHLKGLKDHNPREVFELAISSEIKDKPEFSCWLNKVLKDCNNMICVAISIVKRTTYKNGI